MKKNDKNYESEFNDQNNSELHFKATYFVCAFLPLQKQQIKRLIKVNMFIKFFDIKIPLFPIKIIIFPMSTSHSDSQKFANNSF